MTEKAPKLKRPLHKRILRIILIFLSSFAALLLCIVLLIQTAPVQNFLKGKVVGYLQTKLHTKVEIGKIYISFPKNIVMRDVYFEDRGRDTMFSVRKLSVDISMMKLLHSQIQINEVQLHEATVKIKRLLPDSVFNFQYVVDAFSSPAKTTYKATDTAASKLSVRRISFDNIHAIYDDVVKGDDVDVFLSHLDVNINQMDLQRLYFEIPEINIAGLHGKVYQMEPLTKTVAAFNPSMSSLPKGRIEKIKLDDIQLDYRDAPNAIVVALKVGNLAAVGNVVDLDKKIIGLGKFELANTTASVQLTKTLTSKKINTKSSTGLSSPTSWRIAVKQVHLDENDFSFDDDNAYPQKSGMDYAHLKINDFIMHVNNFSFSNDSITGNISKGSFGEHSGFSLQALQGEFLYSKNQGYVKNLLLRTPGTLLQRTVVLRYPSIESIKNNIGSLLLDVDFANSKLSVKDILTFAPSLSTQPMFKNPSGILLLNANLHGSIRDLKITQLQLSGLQHTTVDMSGSVQGLPNIKSIRATLSIKGISSTRKDILSFISQKNIPNNISIPQTFALSGEVNGAMKDLFTDLVVRTSSGNISVKGYLKNLDDAKNIAYDATVTTQDLNLGYILNNDSAFGNITLEIKVAGKGLAAKTANVAITGIIQSGVFEKYNYQHVSVKASISNQRAKAEVSIRDPNMSLSLNGAADWSAKYPAIKVLILIDSIKTKQLHFTKDDITYHGAINADFPVSDPDNLKGELLVENSRMERNGQKINLDTIKILSGQSDSGRYLFLYTDFVKAHLHGHYKLTEMGLVFQQLLEPYLESSSKKIVLRTEPYDFAVSVSIINRPVLKAILPTLERLDPINFQGHFTSSSGWNADLNAPLIVYGDNRIQNLQLHAKPQVNSLLIQTNLQQFSSGKNLSLYHTSLNGSIKAGTIDFVLNVQDKTAKNKYHVGGLIQKGGSEEYHCSLSPDNLLLNYQKWTVEKNNEIDYSASQIKASNFNLRRGQEQLSIHSVSNEANAPLEILFNKFLISTITAFASTDSLLADGEINGKIILKSVLSKPTFTSDLTIQNLSVHKDTLGNISLKINNTEQDRFSADVTITGRGNDISLNGDYFVKDGIKSNFQFNLDIKTMELSTIVGASSGAIKNASGSVHGKFALTGTLDKPNINGNLAFDKAVLSPAMLNSYYYVDGQKLEVDNDGVNFDHFAILDSAKNKLILDGNVNTGDYKHYAFDLSINAKNFQALNNTKRDNKLYYGRLFLDASVNIKGTDLQPIADGTLHITNKTQFTVVLPQEEPGVEEREGIVRFVDMKSPQQDSILKAGYDSISKSSLRSLDISTNIIIDSTAELTLIVDAANGDHLTTKGTATLTGAIDPSGNTTLSGTYELTHGSYDLSFSVLRKKFEIQKGSTITWTGEPTKANLNISAIYIVKTSPIDLVSNQISSVSNTNNYLQKLPFYVYLKMKGELLKPEISFDIVLPDDKAYSVSKDVVTTVQAKLQLMRQDQGEMNKQVFALLLLNRFLEDDPFQSSSVGPNAESLLRQSVSKILSQQLNQLASNLVHGVDINFDFQSTDDYTTGQLQNRTDLNVSVSKQLLND
ncbi:MAG TPA: translocation/assembly module TamB domain-containing protein, partial [Puia sp.]|nr:translocation/assembly module TamB domain-containing protein [Puia sp.]